MTAPAEQRASDATQVRQLRRRVRDFLRQERDAGLVPRCNSWLTGWDAAFSQRLADAGWVGMCVPVEYGGRGSSQASRYVVVEELLAAGAPVAAHWIADRQIAPCLLRHGTEEQKQRLLPGISAGRHYVAVGLSEPDVGSDLAAVRMRAGRTQDGWTITGTKLWTTGAHRAHTICVLARTSPVDSGDRRAGLSRFLVDLRAPGVTVTPIATLTGEEHFNEVHLEDVHVSHDDVLGEIGSGWQQVTEELAFERSGPERFLSTFPLLVAAVRDLRAAQACDALNTYTIGVLMARLWTLRQMSRSVAARLEEGDAPAVEAALVKDLGTRFEGDLADAVRLALSGVAPSKETERLLREAVLESPSFTLRGGTNEILRGIVARSLGLR